MALETVGIRLIADGAGNYFRDIGKAISLQTDFSAATNTTATAFNTFNAAASKTKLDTLNNQLSTQQTKLGLLAQSLVETSQKYGESSVQAQKKELALQQLSQQISTTQDKILAMTVQVEREAQAMANAITPNEALRRSLEEEAKAAALAEKSTGAFSEIAIGGLRRLGEIGTNALIDLTKNFGGFLTSTIGAAGDLEATMNTFASVTGSSVKDAGLSLDQFKDKFLELGAATQYSATQAAEAGNELAKGGVAIKDIMGDATEATLNLASAAGLELAPAATIVAKQLGVWADSGVTATQVADRLAQVANASTVDVDELAGGLANVGGAAKAAGLTFNQTVDILGLVAPSFKSSETAGTAFANLLVGLQPKTKTATEAMTTLGLYTKDTGSVFYDAQGAFIGTDKAIGFLETSFKDLSDAEKIQLSQMAFGNDGMKVALALADEGTKGNTEFAKSIIGAGTALEQAGVKNQGFNFALESLLGSVDNMKIAIGDKLIPVLTSFINDALIPAVNGIGDFVTHLAPLGPALTTIGSTISTYLKPALIGATGAFIAFQVATGGGLIASLSTLGTGLALIIGQLGTATIAAGSAAVGFAAIALPLAAIAVSLGAVTLGIQDYNKKVASAEAQTLQMAKGYGQGTAALDGYNKNLVYHSYLSKEAQAATGVHAFMIKNLQGQLVAATDAYFSLGGGTQENLDKIASLNNQLKAESSALSTLNAANTETIQKTQDLNAAEDARHLSIANTISAQSQLTTSIGLTAEAYEKLLGDIEKINEKGTTAFDTLVGGYQAHTNTMTGLQIQFDKATTEEQQKAIQDQMNQATIAYAEQERMQRESLGKQLIALAEAEGQKNGLTTTAIQDMTLRLSQEYGVQQDLSATSFANMSADIAQWASDGGKGADQVISSLRETTATAETTSATMNALAVEYTLTLHENLEDGKINADQFLAAMKLIPNEQNVNLVQNYLDGKSDVDAFINAVNAIPTHVNVNVNTEYTTHGSPPPGGGYTPMASGGLALRGKPILVGDTPSGQLTPYSELIVPKTDSMVYDAAATRRIFSNKWLGGSAFSTATTGTQSSATNTTIKTMAIAVTATGASMNIPNGILRYTDAAKLTIGNVNGGGSNVVIGEAASGGIMIGDPSTSVNIGEAASGGIVVGDASTSVNIGESASGGIQIGSADLGNSGGIIIGEADLGNSGGGVIGEADSGSAPPVVIWNSMPVPGGGSTETDDWIDAGPTNIGTADSGSASPIWNSMPVPTLPPWIDAGFSATPPPSPQAIASRSMLASAQQLGNVTNKNYTFAPTIQAPANDLIRSFRLMETFAL